MKSYWNHSCDMGNILLVRRKSRRWINSENSAVPSTLCTQLQIKFRLPTPDNVLINMLNATSPEKVPRVGTMKMTMRLPFIHHSDSPCWSPAHYHAGSPCATLAPTIRFCANASGIPRVLMLLLKWTNRRTILTIHQRIYAPPRRYFFDKYYH